MSISLSEITVEDTASVSPSLLQPQTSRQRAIKEELPFKPYSPHKPVSMQPPTAAPSETFMLLEDVYYGTTDANVSNENAGAVSVFLAQVSSRNDGELV